jgi:hypothetical protein
MNFQYQIYGLSINSSRRIGVLNEKPHSDADVTAAWTTDATKTPEAFISWQRVITPDLKTKERISFFKTETPDGTYCKLCFITGHGELAIIISPAKDHLWLIYDPNEPETNLDSYFVGSVLGCVLRLRGVLCLHSSVVRINNQAVVFLGRKKSGKSTTAAAFAKLGYMVMADDIAVITTVNNQFYIKTGYPKVRLRPKSLAVIHPGSPENFVSVNSHRDSRYSDIQDNFWDTPLPLGAIYILSETVNADDAPFIKQVNSGAMIELHANTFANFIITADLRKQEFEELARLVMSVPVKRLHFGRNVELVNLQCKAVIEDLEKLKQY